MSNRWTQSDAIALCVKVEKICPAFGCHVALTGGLLYKDGERKDCDILFYSIRGREIDKDGLRLALIDVGFDTFMDYGFVQKTRYHGKAVDVFFPEHPISDPSSYAAPQTVPVAACQAEPLWRADVDGAFS